MADHAWPAYLERFHAEHPGITAEILRRCRADGIDAYEWCARPLADRGPVIDVACGNGPMARHLTGWIGSDVSGEELRVGRCRPVVLASALELPFATGSAASVVCSMAAQVIQPLDRAISEMARVLRPGGRAALMVPTTHPLPLRDALTYLRLQLALRRRIRYPNDPLLTPSRLVASATAAGLHVVQDERRGFTLPLTTADHAAELVRSLYLPDIDPRRLAAGRRALRSRIGSELAVPLRRVVLERVGGGA